MWSCAKSTHRAGEKLFVEYVGQTAEIIDRQSGEEKTAQIFVAVLRNDIFFSLESLNREIYRLLKVLNERPFK